MFKNYYFEMLSVYVPNEEYISKHSVCMELSIDLPIEHILQITDEADLI